MINHTQVYLDNFKIYPTKIPKQPRKSKGSSLTELDKIYSIKGNKKPRSYKQIDRIRTLDAIRKKWFPEEEHNFNERMGSINERIQAFLDKSFLKALTNP
jgi:hypothetical protein